MTNIEFLQGKPFEHKEYWLQYYSPIEKKKIRIQLEEHEIPIRRRLLQQANMTDIIAVETKTIVKILKEEQPSEELSDILGI